MSGERTPEREKKKVVGFRLTVAGMAMWASRRIRFFVALIRVAKGRFRKSSVNLRPGGLILNFLS